jgi:hypothetical protein
MRIPFAFPERSLQTFSHGQLSFSMADSFKKAKAPKPTNASLLFPEIQRELTANPEFAGSLMGLFVIEVLERGNRNETWYLIS